MQLLAGLTSQIEMLVLNVVAMGTFSSVIVECIPWVLLCLTAIIFMNSQIIFLMQLFECREVLLDIYVDPNFF